jgi:hypothetical protein
MYGSEGSIIQVGTVTKGRTEERVDIFLHNLVLIYYCSEQTRNQSLSQWGGVLVLSSP